MSKENMSKEIIRSEPVEHLLNHRGRRYRLFGELVAWDRENAGTGRSYAYDLYRSPEGQFYLHTHYQTQWEGEEDIYTIEKISIEELNRRFPSMAREAGVEEILDINDLK